MQLGDVHTWCEHAYCNLCARNVHVNLITMIMMPGSMAIAIGRLNNIISLCM